jgi:hypothetical protein
VSDPPGTSDAHGNVPSVVNGPDPSQFFQIVAGVLPALLFGGVLRSRAQVEEAEKWWKANSERGGRSSRRPWKYHVVPPAALCIFVAEGFALAGALGSGLPTVMIYWVIGTVVIATYAMALTIVWPWWYGQNPSRRSLGRLAVASVVTVLVTMSLLKSSIDFAQVQQQALAAVAGYEMLERQPSSATRLIPELRSLRLEELSAAEAEVRERLALGRISRSAAHRKLLGLVRERKATIKAHIEWTKANGGVASEP